MKSLLPCLTIVSFASYSSAAVYLSPFPLNSGADGSTPNIELNVGDTQTLYVYWSGPRVDHGFSLDVSPSQAGIVGITGARTFEFSLGILGERWDYAGAASGPQSSLNTGPGLLGDVNLDGVVDFFDIGAFVSVLVSGGFQTEADLDMDGAVDFLDSAPFEALLPKTGFTPNEANLSAFAISAEGIVPAVASFDTGYDSTAGAFLVGSFDFEALAPGSITLNTSEGIAQIVDNGVALSPTFGTANINVIPEPGVGLLVASSVCFLLFRRKAK